MIVLNICLGIVAFFLINFIGRFLIPKSYQNDLFDDEQGKDTVFNIAFRVVAPVVVLVFGGLACWSANREFVFSELLIALLVYWLLRLICWIVKRDTVKSRIWMVLAQALTSILICWFLTYSIGDNPLEALMPNMDDVSFEFTLLTFIVIFFILAESPAMRKDRSPEVMEATYEKKLFKIDQICRDVLPERFNEDIALKILLYAFALCEDTHRPPSVRAIERILLRMHLSCFVKTAGLMQVPTKRPISDEESAEIAARKVSEIYDAYLTTSANFSINPAADTEDGWTCGENLSKLTFFEEGYSYRLSEMTGALYGDVSTLYGKYCGTYQLNIEDYFYAAESFVRNQYGQDGNRRIEVRRKIDLDGLGLSVNGYWRIGEKDGFASLGGGDAARILISRSSDLSLGLTGIILDHGLAGQVFLLYEGLDGTLVVVNEDAEQAKIRSLAENLSASIEMDSYHFDDFIKNSGGFIHRWLVVESFG